MAADRRRGQQHNSMGASMKISANCVEAQGFFAALEEALAEGELDDAAAGALADAWVASHAAECPVCREVN